MCSTGILMLLCINQSTFTTLQAQTMDRRIFGHFQIPAGSFTSIMIIILTIWVAFYDRILVPLLSKFTGCPRGLSCKVRMGIGLLLVCAARAMSAMIETFRRSEAIEQGLENYPDGMVNMSALWLVPEYALLGIAQAFNAIGQIEFFYFYFPKSMSSFAMALYTLEIAASDMVGTLLVNIVDKVTSKGGKESWLSSNINRGHLNYYYGLLTFLGLINYLYFLAICWASGHTEEGKTGTSEITEDEQIDYRELPSS
ncbi:hypothetical protein L6164_024132 [Bauhinia variegata]|nr:hypothetical protein L6164_024132 [Bauhinia variegata]